MNLSGVGGGKFIPLLKILVRYCEWFLRQHSGEQDELLLNTSWEGGDPGETEKGGTMSPSARLLLDEGGLGLLEQNAAGGD
jgi:hypothetical protein